jgi:CubicO group peptidase (beta-lactamase class C family)
MTSSPSLSRRALITALAAGAFALASRGAARPHASRGRTWRAAQTLFDDWTRSRRMAGCAAALSVAGEPFTFLKAGTIALESQTSFDEMSLCRIYSMTKSVTGAAVMLLVDTGKLSLDLPVAEVLPEWRTLLVAHDRSKNLEARPATKPMTLRHLLTHTSGLGDWTPAAAADPLTVAYRQRGITPGNRGIRLTRPGYGPQATDLKDMVQRVADLPLVAEPGTAYVYSNVGYAALGLAIERVSGTPLDKYCQERIFGPLGMTSTGFRVAREQLMRFTTNYDVTDTGLSVTDAAESSAWLHQPTLIDGGGGVISTARDFARFSTMILNDGRLGDVELLRPETARLARSNLMPAGLVAPSNIMPADVAGNSGYGTGVRVALAARSAKPFQSAGTVSHGGAAGTLWYADPIHQATLVFMTQTMPPIPGAAVALLKAVDADVG